MRDFFLFLCYNYIVAKLPWECIAKGVCGSSILRRTFISPHYGSYPYCRDDRTEGGDRKMTLQSVKAMVELLYRTSPDIYVSVNVSHPRVVLDKVPVTITGVYPHVFRVKERGTPTPKSYTVQYTDLLTKQVTIM